MDSFNYIPEDLVIEILNKTDVGDLTNLCLSSNKLLKICQLNKSIIISKYKC